MEKRKRPLIGISSCLLGNNVRYNNGHTRDKWITRELEKYVDFYPFCPEVEMGLGVPREEIHLVYQDDDRKNVQLYSKVSKKNLTDKASKTYDRLNREMSRHLINGVILMKKSPSCGLTNVKTVNKSGNGPVTFSKGLYTKSLDEFYPLVPKEESGRIKQPELREHFLKNVFAHFRYEQVEKSISSIQDFHKKYKYIIMEHSPVGLKKLGLVASNPKNKPALQIYKDYGEIFFEILGKKPKKSNRYSTLFHIMGYFKNFLTSEDKRELIINFDEYRNGIQSYMAVVTLIQFLVKKYKLDYFEDNYYFNPYPKELKLLKDVT